MANVMDYHVAGRMSFHRTGAPMGIRALSVEDYGNRKLASRTRELQRAGWLEFHAWACGFNNASREAV